MSIGIKEGHVPLSSVGLCLLESGHFVPVNIKHSIVIFVCTYLRG